MMSLIPCSRNGRRHVKEYDFHQTFAEPSQSMFLMTSSFCERRKKEREREREKARKKDRKKEGRTERKKERKKETVSGEW